MSNPLTAVYYANKINTILLPVCWKEPLRVWRHFCCDLGPSLATEELTGTSRPPLSCLPPCQISWHGAVFTGLCKLPTSSSSSFVLPLKNVKGFLDREFREEHRRAYQLRPRGLKTCPSVSPNSLTVESVEHRAWLVLAFHRDDAAENLLCKY